MRKILVDQVVDRNGNGLHDDHGDAESDGGIDLFRNGEKGAHAEEKGERHILDKNRLDQETEVMLHRLVLFDLVGFPGAQNPDQQTDDKEGARWQQHQAVRLIPAAFADGRQDGEAEQFAGAEQFTEKATRSRTML